MPSGSSSSRTTPRPMRWTTVPRPYGLDDAHDFLAKIEREWGTPDGRRHWAVTDAADPRGPLPGHGRPAPAWRRRRGDRLRPAPRGAGPGPDGGRAAAGLPLVVREGGARVHWLADRGNFASWRVAWSCGFAHHGTVPQSHPDPDDAVGPGARRVAGQPGRRRRDGAAHPVGGRAGAGGAGRRRHPAAARGATTTSTPSSRATSPTTTCRRAGCSTPTASPSG